MSANRQLDAMSEIDSLAASIRSAAERSAIPVDIAAYERAGRDPLDPVLYGGSLDSRTAFFARDLGRDEVLLGEPLIGGAGRRVRQALFRHLRGYGPPTGDVRLSETTGRVLLANTVPYKPVGNKAYSGGVKEMLRPFIAGLLVCAWRGDYVITLGTEAFLWFAPYAARGAAEAFWRRPDRFEAEFACTIVADCDGHPERKPVTLAPLPHPSPLNQTYLALFPSLLERRLRQAPLEMVDARWADRQQGITRHLRP